MAVCLRPFEVHRLWQFQRPLKPAAHPLTTAGDEPIEVRRTARAGDRQFVLGEIDLHLIETTSGRSISTK